MQSMLRRTALGRVRAARTHLRRTTQRTARRGAHDSHGSGHHAEPVNEHFGRWFYIALAAAPTLALLYNLTAPSADPSAPEPLLTRFIARQSDLSHLWVERNDRHVRMIEQAAADRTLLMHSRPSQTVELKFPETFNTGSPWNVPAGHYANIDRLVEHYRKECFEDNERKLADLREGRVVDIYAAEKPKPKVKGEES